ncbi:MAG: hypothetical protein M1822_001877 [Bathelium mastoideum]|nr:MAG: hypothetical protein M1822_001877 [Bathelium mastoideum]
MEGFPMRTWNISVFLLDEAGNDVEASIFEKVTYKLHPTFGKRATQVFREAPFRIQEKGWGEFDLSVILTAINKGGDHTIEHDLNFASERYEAKHTVTFRNPKPELMERLKDSGPVGDENGTRTKAADSAKKRSRKGGNVDMEKLADGLQRLNEDDLLHVVQLVHDNKSPETYTKNDIENGEFHVDLYTLPDNLVKMLWDFTTSKTEI